MVVLVSYLSPAYGGSVGHCQIMERINSTSLFYPGDSIMANKAFSVQDLFAQSDVTIKFATFFLGNAIGNKQCWEKEKYQVNVFILKGSGCFTQNRNKARQWHHFCSFHVMQLQTMHYSTSCFDIEAKLLKLDSFLIMINHWK